MSGFYVVAYDLRGIPIGDLPVGDVSVTANLNAPDTASMTVTLDPSWGAPREGDHLVPKGLMQLLTPWTACVGVFDEDSDVLLFYGPIVKRRRGARRQSRSGSSETIDIECSAWDAWLEHVYPELELVFGAGPGQTAEVAVAKVLWGDLYETSYEGWGLPGTPTLQTPDADVRGSVAGRAGVAFGNMPIVRIELASKGLVSVDWSTTGPGKLGQTSAAAFIQEIVDQGHDFRVEGRLNSATSGIQSRPYLTPSPAVTSIPPPDGVVFIAGGNVAAASMVDRGDLYAALVRVTSGQDAGEYPRLVPGVSAGFAMLVERARPAQQSGGTPGVAALEVRASTLQKMLFPAPLEYGGVEVSDRLPTLKPGDLATFVTPSGVDVATGGVGWEAIVRVQSVTWDASSPGCKVSLVEPGSDSAVRSIPPPGSFVAGLATLRQQVTGLLSR